MKNKRRTGQRRPPAHQATVTVLFGSAEREAAASAAGRVGRQRTQRLLVKLLFLSLPPQRESTVILEPLGNEHGWLAPSANRFHNLRSEEPSWDNILTILRFERR
jgi:hypothetical protein